MNESTKDMRKKNIDETFKSGTTNRNEEPLCRIYWQVNTTKNQFQLKAKKELFF